MPNELPESPEPLNKGLDSNTGLEQDSLSLDVFSDPKSFKEALKTGGLNGQNDQTLVAFDTKTSSVEISEDGQNSTVSKDGKVVREISQSGGNDTVIAYDADGTAHRFEDTKIHSFPIDFSTIPDWRREQIRNRVTPLLDNYTEGPNPHGGKDGKISFNDMASIMKDISKMPDLTEVEKAQLWTDVAHSINEGDVDVLDNDQRKDTKDSWLGSWDMKHAVLGLSDGYHANRLINMSEAEASQEIIDHENGSELENKSLPKRLGWLAFKTVFGVNTGDINASESALKALRNYRDEGTFAAFARTWEKEFVLPDVDRHGQKKAEDK